VDKGIIEKSGTWYSYKGERVGQGRENAKKFLQGNPELIEKITQEIRNKLGLDNVVDTKPEEGEEE
jgi:recombination protein RecA